MTRTLVQFRERYGAYIGYSPKKRRAGKNPSKNDPLSRGKELKERSGSWTYQTF